MKKKIIPPLIKERHPDCRSCEFYQFCDAEKKCEFYSPDSDVEKKDNIINTGELF
jgi:hypothetical protein